MNLYAYSDGHPYTFCHLYWLFLERLQRMDFKKRNSKFVLFVLLTNCMFYLEKYYKLYNMYYELLGFYLNTHTHIIVSLSSSNGIVIEDIYIFSF